MENQNIKYNVYYFFIQKGKAQILLIASLIIKRNIIINSRRCITFMGLCTQAFCAVTSPLYSQHNLGSLIIQNYSIDPNEVSRFLKKKNLSTSFAVSISNIN